ncbi:MAG TPA: ABC transporter ATP-binding protein, partial [Phycicoccus sp.]|nr:ABC transporter ATP-binding protein [Phycicoccus sp.]
MNKDHGRHAAGATPDGAKPTGDAIVVDHLKVKRGTRLVLPDLSVRVPKGQVIGLLGPSGG